MVGLVLFLPASFWRPIDVPLSPTPYVPMQSTLVDRHQTSSNPKPCALLRRPHHTRRPTLCTDQSLDWWD